MYQLTKSCLDRHICAGVFAEFLDRNRIQADAEMEREQNDDMLGYPNDNGFQIDFGFTN